MSLSSEEKKRIVSEIVAELRACERYAEQDLLNRYHLNKHEARLIWVAREELRRTDGIEFGPLKDHPGCFERKPWDKIAKRAERQRAKGTRAHRRAAEKLRLAATLAPEEQAKQKLQDAADRVDVRLHMARVRGG